MYKIILIYAVLLLEIGCKNGQVRNTASGSTNQTNEVLSDKGSKCAMFYDTYAKRHVYQHCDVDPVFDSEGPLGRYLYDRFMVDSSFQLTFSMACIIDERGRVRFPRIVGKEESQYSSSERKLVRILADMPKWTPGICDGKAVACYVNIPLVF